MPVVDTAVFEVSLLFSSLEYYLSLASRSPTAEVQEKKKKKKKDPSEIGRKGTLQEGSCKEVDQRGPPRLGTTHPGVTAASLFPGYVVCQTGVILCVPVKAAGTLTETSSILKGKVYCSCGSIMSSLFLHF